MSLTPFVVLALFGLALGDKLPLPRLNGRIVGRVPTTPYIFGGESTTIEKYPYQLSLRWSGFHKCGASIIGPYHALTAAHCVSGATPSRISLHAGTSYQSRTGSKHQAKTITVHPKYQASNYDYDFAIIEVDTPFPIGQSGIQTIGLCSVEPSAGQTAVLTGWGRLSVAGSTANELQVVTVPVISRATCQRKYPQYNVTQSMICAATENGGKDACDGDSGSPMVVEGKQCGIVSWGIECGHENYPGVYSNVADQLSWIQQTANI